MTEEPIVISIFKILKIESCISADQMDPRLFDSKIRRQHKIFCVVHKNRIHVYVSPHKKTCLKYIVVDMTYRLQQKYMIPDNFSD